MGPLRSTAASQFPADRQLKTRFGSPPLQDGTVEQRIHSSKRNDSVTIRSGSNSEKFGETPWEGIRFSQFAAAARSFGRSAFPAGGPLDAGVVCNGAEPMD